MGVYTGTPPTFLAGELPDADKFDEITDYMTAATAAWTSYSPTWRSGGTQPALVNGTLVANYRRLGKTVNVSIILTVGSSSTFGTGLYFFDLPTPAVRSAAGTVAILDSSLGAFTIGICVATGLAGLPGLSYLAPLSATGAAVTGTSPITLATNDVILMNATYEAA